MRIAARLARRPWVGALAACAVLGACSNPQASSRAPSAGTWADESGTTQALRNDIDTVVVIFAENRAFDNLYGNFPNARGLREVVAADGADRVLVVEIALEEAHLRRTTGALGLEARARRHQINSGHRRRAGLLGEKGDRAVDAPHASDVGKRTARGQPANELFARPATAADRAPL